MTAWSLVLWLFVAILPSSRASQTKEQSLGPAHFSILGVTIGQDNLKTLQSKLGTVQKCRGTRHDGAKIAGYAGSNEKLVFEFGEVGGGDVTGFYISSLHAAAGCTFSQLPSKTSKLTTEAGVHLGMRQEDFLRTFGSPKSRTGGLWKYEWTWEEKYSEEEKKKAADAGNTIGNMYMVGITIEARFTKGVLRYFYISKLETT